MKTKFKLFTATVLCTLLSLAASGQAKAQNLLENGDLEAGTTGWELYIPEDAMAAECKFEASKDEAHKSTQAGKLMAKDPARYCALQYPKGLTFTAGDRYRVTAWVRAGRDFKPQSGTPGYALRVTMFSEESTSLSSSNPDSTFFFVGAKDKAVKGVTTVLNNQEIPKSWEKLEGVFEIVPGTARLNVCIFVSSGAGSFFFDDVMLEKVPNTTPLSKLLGDSK